MNNYPPGVIGFEFQINPVRKEKVKGREGDQMTDQEYNQATTILMGKEWDDALPKTIQETAATVSYIEDNPDHLNNPLPVIRWMEKEMPKVWESYLYNSFRGELYTDIINSILDLRNLVHYLRDNPSWGEKECDCLDGHEPYLATEDGDVDFRMCDACSGSGRIIHPFLKFVREGK